MEMSNGEIARSYTAAKNKREQIQILAQLNNCSEAVIKDVLKSEGVPGNQMPRYRGIKAEKPDDKPEEQGGNPEKGERQIPETCETAEEPLSVTERKAIEAIRTTRPDIYCELLNAYAASIEEENEAIRERLAFNEAQIGRVKKLVAGTGWNG